MSTDTEYRDAIVAAHPYVPGPHDPGDSEFFQESLFLCWADHETGFGGFQRIGQEVNRGLANQWTAAYGPDGTKFRRLDSMLELDPEWRADDAFRGGDVSTCRFAGDSRWEVRTPSYEADLELHDFHPIMPFYAAGKDSADRLGRGCPLLGGLPSRATGRRVADHGHASSSTGRSYEIDGRAIRDHSFGFRDWTIIRNHRAIRRQLRRRPCRSRAWSGRSPTTRSTATATSTARAVEEWTDDADIVVSAGRRRDHAARRRGAAADAERRGDPDRRASRRPASCSRTGSTWRSTTAA